MNGRTKRERYGFYRLHRTQSSSIDVIEFSIIYGNCIDIFTPIFLIIFLLNSHFVIYAKFNEMPICLTLYRQIVTANYICVNFVDDIILFILYQWTLSETRRVLSLVRDLPANSWNISKDQIVGDPRARALIRSVGIFSVAFKTPHSREFACRRYNYTDVINA